MVNKDDLITKPNEEGMPAVAPTDLDLVNDELTIITATIGRDTLKRTQDSVRAQALAVKHIIVYDKDKRSAGLTKTQGARQAETEWIAFVDDDDTIDPLFSTWWAELRDKCDAIVFKCNNKVLNKIVPEPGYDNPKTLTKSHIGLSLAVKREIFLEHPYWNERDMGAPEDWEFIRWLKEDTPYRILVSPHVAYTIHVHGGRQ